MFAFLFLLLLAQISNPQAQDGSVTGILRTTTGRPASGIRVTAMVPPQSPSDVLNSIAMASVTETDADGRYRLERIPPGRYYITAGRVDFPTYYPGAVELSGGHLVLVTAGGIVSAIDFVLKDESVRPRTVSNSLGYTIPVAIQVDGGGKVPFYQQGTYPVVRLIEITANKAVEIGFADGKAVLPVPANANGDEYRVTVADLRDGYSVKSITYGAADLQRETLKIPPGSPRTSNTTLNITLTTPSLPQTGRRVAGSGPVFGDEIYISNSAGILYTDGSFEFRDVPPGLHRIVKVINNVVTAAPVVVGDRDVEGVRLEPTTILPADIFSDPPKTPSGTFGDSKTLSLRSITGRVLDEISQEAINEGVVTIAGYGATQRGFAITSDGHFEIPALLPGSYRITLNISGYFNATHEVTVGAEDLKLDLIGRREPH
jgi:hypothetical protein